MTCRRWLVPVIAAALSLPLQAAADDAQTALRTCRAEPDDARRLACYDREMDRAGNAPMPVAAASAEAPELSPEQRFGRRGSMTREEADRKEQESRELGELTATVVEIWTRSDGLTVMTLDNGQVWAQSRPDPFFRIKNGDRVKIQPAALGSFLLSGPSKRSTRVTRTR